MGQASRARPIRLAEKLLHVRMSLGLSQNEIVRRLGLADQLSREKVSAYERGEREPSLPVLLRYARVAGVYLDALVDDSINLPNKLPASPQYEWSLPRTRRR